MLKQHYGGVTPLPASARWGYHSIPPIYLQKALAGQPGPALQVLSVFLASVCS